MLHASGSNCCALMWGHEKGEGNTHTHFALRTRVRAVLWSPLFVLCCGLPCCVFALVVFTPSTFHRARHHDTDQPPLFKADDERPAGEASGGRRRAR